MSDTADRPCPEWRELMNGLIDGELDAEHARRVEAHLAEHPACARQLEQLQQSGRLLRGAYPPLVAPIALRQRLVSALGQNGRRSIRDHILGLFDVLHRLSLPASVAVLAVSLALVVWPRPVTIPELEADLIAGHVRSLLADHLTDIATSDRHQVKPWFNGKTDFSPPVFDLKSQGFPLQGGRLDYVGGKVVAALVFRHDGHVINLFVWPGSTASAPAEDRGGYHLVGWVEGDLVFEAVSDLNAAELATFASTFRAAAKQ
ncbi:MAG: anti-sigma factor [Ancalomicrobiaceae bacterium]|nr:anti-sigma factor [Ancalomicrobiaceae bacterium]